MSQKQCPRCKNLVGGLLKCEQCKIVFCNGVLAMSKLIQNIQQYMRQRPQYARDRNVRAIIL